MKNPKLETISFDTIAKAVKNCTDIKSDNFLTWNDFEIDEDIFTKAVSYSSCSISPMSSIIGATVA